MIICLNYMVEHWPLSPGCREGRETVHCGCASSFHVILNQWFILVRSVTSAVTWWFTLSVGVWWKDCCCCLRMTLMGYKLMWRWQGSNEDTRKVRIMFTNSCRETKWIFNDRFQIKVLNGWLLNSAETSK